MNTLRKNTIANFIARAWGFVSVYLFVPVYLKILGVEAYGLIGFYSTLLGVLAFADMGFTATLNREMARLSARKESAGEMRDLLRTYELTYLCISSVLAVIIWILAPTIAERWLQAKALQPVEISKAIQLMGVAVAIQLPFGLYMGGLMGLERQVLSNSLQVSWGVFRGLGAVLVLWLFSPTIYAFALWQLISNALYCFFARFSLWRALPFNPREPFSKFKLQVFRNTWRYAASMAGMAVVSTLLTQTDKLAVSKMLSLEMLGYYSLAGALASVPLVLASPIATATFPRFTGMVAMGDRNGLAHLYHRTCELVAVVIIPAGITAAVFAVDCIFTWTGSAITARQAGLVASLLLVGQLLQAITVVPYYLALAHGEIRFILFIGSAMVVSVTPLLIILIKKFGVVGAGLSWLVLNLCALPPYMYYLHHRFIPGEFWQWCFRGVARPFLAALPCVLLGRWIVPHTTSRVFTFCFVGLVWGVSAVAAAATVPELRTGFMKQTCRIIGVSFETE